MCECGSWTTSPKMSHRWPMTPSPSLSIHRWHDLPHPEALISGIDAIFYETAGTQSFPDEAARVAFRERWLGRYLTHDAAHVWLALAHDGAVAGYLVGCLEDPVRTERFSDIGYFAELATVTRLYPAHLHINLTATVRGHGAGSRLIEGFATQAAASGSPGLHVVTGAGMRNVRFYARNGLSEVARFCWPPHAPERRELVMLGRRLAPRPVAL